MPCARLVLFVLLSGLTLAVGAQEPWPRAGADVAGQVDARGWPVVPDLSKVGKGERTPAPTPIGEITAREGETVAQVMGRAAALAARYTAETGFEACALVCEDPHGRPALRLTTSFSQVSCATEHLPWSCPDGARITKETLHSHPQVDSVVLNPVDAIATGQRAGRRLKILPHGFSERDLANGPGWLVTSGKLLHQEGEGTVRIVGPSLHGTRTE